MTSNIDATHITDVQSYGLVLRLLRTESGKTLSEVEAETGVSRYKVHRLESENPTARVTVAEQAALLKAYGRVLQFAPVEAAQL